MMRTSVDLPARLSARNANRSDPYGGRAFSPRAMPLSMASRRLTVGHSGSSVPGCSSLRLFVVEDTQERMGHLTPEQKKDRNRYPFPFEAAINPIWYATSPEMAIETEGCLSIPGFKADVFRYWAIEVEGFQPDGRRKTWSIKGWPVRIFQHEIDHLDGRLLTDCLLPGHSHRSRRTA
jgi:peptide deformylase